jgi:hypothetical protein
VSEGNGTLVHVPAGTDLLVPLEQGRRALAEARTIQEAKQWRDLAKASADLIKQQKLSEAAYLDAMELKLWAEARLGEFLQENVQHQGGDARTLRANHGARPDGISEWQSRTWQMLARVKDQIPAYIAAARAKGKDLATAPLVKRAARRAADAKKRATLLQEALTGKFPVIYADPPWTYHNVGLNGAASNHYPTMATEAICALPVPDITTANAVLFLWSSPPLLEDALQVMKAWGFSYKTNLVWDKDRIGTGFYIRSQHELVLLGVKGTGMCPEESRRPASIVRAERRRHSAQRRATAASCSAR